MPLTPKGNEIEESMEKEYGPSKGEQVFYASKNAGKITGVDAPKGVCSGFEDILRQNGNY
jgi:hypothetical protein